MAKRKYTKSVVAAAVKDSYSVAEVIRRLEIGSTGGGVWSMIQRYIQEYQLDTSHFKGKAHAKGRPSARRLKASQIFRILIGPHRETGTRLTRALLEVGTPYECVLCGLGDTWNSRPLVLEVDHIDGNWRNCLRKNLRLLCPNCHSQEPYSKNTNTYVEVSCGECKTTFLRKAQKVNSRGSFCSYSCASKQRSTPPEKGTWPSDESLRSSVWEQPMTRLATKIGVSEAAVRKRCKRLSIPTPPRGYWAKQRSAG